MPERDTLDIDINRVLPFVTLHVRLVGQRRFAVRRWIALQLIRLAARVLSFGLIVEPYEIREDVDI